MTAAKGHRRDYLHCDAHRVYNFTVCTVALVEAVVIVALLGSSLRRRWREASERVDGLLAQDRWRAAAVHEDDDGRRTDQDGAGAG